MSDVGDHARTKLELVQDAVQMALSARWEEAVSANLEIQERFGEDEETANRLGKALIETGRFEEAQEAYQRALALNPLNQIAKRQLSKLDELMEGRAAAVPGEASLPPRFFTEEPGKTTMTRIAPPARVDPAQVAAGDPVELELGDGEVLARTLRGVSLGALEPRLAQRVRHLVSLGNRYQAGVVRVEGGSVNLLIREVHQAPEAVGTVAFPVRKGREAEYRPYAKEALLARDTEPLQLDDDDQELVGTAPVRTELDEGFGEFEDGDEADEPVVDDDDDLDEEEEEF